MHQEVETKTQILQKTKKVFKFILLSVFFGIVFYSFEFIKPHSNEYEITKELVLKANKENISALKSVKKFAEGSTVYEEYITANKNKKIAVKKFNAAKNNEQVFGFKTLKIFSKEFGIFLGFFLYALFNLYRSFRYERLNTGIKIYHSFIISVCVFYFFWMFQQFQDFSKPVYYLMTIASAYFVFLAMYLLFKNKKTKEEQLRANLMEVAKFTFKNTKPEKREEMLDLIKEIAKRK